MTYLVQSEIARSPDRAGRTRVEDAAAWIDANLAPLPAEDVPLADAAGRILAEDVQAAINVPAFDRAVADGFALRADETVGAGSYNPIPFRPGPAADHLAAGCAVRVNAGDPLPHGADAVAALEQCADNAGGSVTLIAAVAPGALVERAGNQAARGSRLAASGRRLRPVDIGLLASTGLVRVPTIRRPRVLCLLTGRSAIPAGIPLSFGAVHNANGPLLCALIERDGGLPMEPQRVDRALTSIRSALAQSGADIVLVAGSTGPGPDDHAAAALAAAGELAIHGIALRPGDTAGIGRTAAGVPVALLPGTPAACLWTYEFLAGRAIRRLGGRNPALPFPSRRMTAARKIVSEIGMTEVCPVQCSKDGTAAPIASFAEAGLMAAVRADGFVVVPEGREGYPQGAVVTVYLYDADGAVSA
ncbi:MAG: molybdopterin molybdotransferase MoeA [Hyphomicrobiaceae bacterium]